ncbi:MAG: SUMF1/EgtB/PvdO family nonheme iron enzyme [Saprospiraceae bacterium]
MKQLYYIALAIILLCNIDQTAAQSKSDMPNVKIPKGFVFIEGGNYQLTPDAIVPIRSFFMSSTEVSNLEYRTFLADLKRNGTEEEYAKASIVVDTFDTLNHFAIFQIYAENPAYDDYPVVNVTRAGIDLYCAYLNKMIGQDKKSEYQIRARLPSAIEWEFAATGGVPKKKYPWDGNSLTDSKGRQRACYHTSNDSITTFMSPVKSFEKTDNGLYNIIGNVAEMTNEIFDVVKGGSWHAQDGQLFIQNNDYLKFRGVQSSPAIGFRPIISIYPKSILKIEN